MSENRDSRSSRIEDLRERRYQAWQNCKPQFVETLLAGVSTSPTEYELLELIYAEITMRAELGETCKADEYVQRFPGIAKPLGRLFEIHDYFAIEDIPQRVGRYRIERVLGAGNFGVVYRGYDEQLMRSVAVKVPHARLTSRPEDVEAYLTEARIVASLDHPNIVAVLDVGATTEFPCYIVSKFIEGSDLATRLKESRLSMQETAELVTSVAEALYFAHTHGLVHRDVKPGNILIDRSGKAFVFDFGLALREHDVGKGPGYAGTPAYMSPEQVRGEGHRVDGRSDLFSLGVVFYELLVGQRPFRGETSADLIEPITSFEPRAPRMHDDQIPQELDRICLKALSKRASERYSTAKAMADDLHHFLRGVESGGWRLRTQRQSICSTWITRGRCWPRLAEPLENFLKTVGITASNKGTS